MATHDTPNPSNRTLEITRTFDAPRELIFKAWKERNQIEQQPIKIYLTKQS
jgi:uncharacterized protein YndB with AHSA1/START domain